MIIRNLTILQIIIPLISSVTFPLVGKRTVKIAALIVSFLGLVISSYLAYSFFASGKEVRIFLGGFEPPYGIELKLNYLNSLFLLSINFILFTFIFGLQNIIESTEGKNLFYALLFLAAGGLMGMVITADIFNLYVFLEISSLATYALFSTGKDKRALLAAFEYLIIGTISATLILLGIGFLFALTGTLNMDDLHLKLTNLYHLPLIRMGCIFFIVGCLLKIALFPMNIWIIRVYAQTSPLILTFFAIISASVGIYVLLNFLYKIVDGQFLLENLGLKNIFLVIGILGTLVSTLCAYRSHDLVKILIYSANAQLGYIFILIGINNIDSLSLGLNMIFVDMINKAIFFSIISFLYYKYNSTKLESLSFISCTLTRVILGFTIISNAGLPFSAGFMNKYGLFCVLFKQKYYISLATLFIITYFTLIYNYRLFSRIFVKKQDTEKIDLSLRISILMLGLISLFFTIKYNYLEQIFTLISQYLLWNYTI